MLPFVAFVVCHLPAELRRSIYLSCPLVATPSPFPYSLSFPRSLKTSIHHSPSDSGCPHLSYCNHILVFQSHTPHVTLLLVYQAVCICVPFDTCLILSKSPCTPITVAHVLITPDFHFFIYLQTVITILSVSGLIFSTTEKQD